MKKRLALLQTLVLAANIASAEAAEGTVEFFKEDDGYGYVTDSDSNETYLFESADIITGPVQKGDSVSFMVTTQDDRFRVKAQSVTLLQVAVPLDAGADAVDATIDASDDSKDVTDAENNTVEADANTQP